MKKHIGKLLKIESYVILAICAPLAVLHLFFAILGGASEGKEFFKMLGFYLAGIFFGAAPLYGLSYVIEMLENFRGSQVSGKEK